MTEEQIYVLALNLYVQANKEGSASAELNGHYIYFHAERNRYYLRIFKNGVTTYKEEFSPNDSIVACIKTVLEKKCAVK